MARWAGRLWGAAGVLGMAVAVVIVQRDPFPSLPTGATVLIAIACGWAAMLIAAPWRHMNTLSRNRAVTLELTRKIRRFTSGERDDPLSTLILDRDDELGDLSRTVHDALALTLTHQHESRMLQRRMDDEIKRETSRATIRLVREAETDPLTGLGNRRALERRLEELFGGDRRRRRDVITVMVIDLDAFKAINDTLGHDVGDECLAFLGRLLSSTLRSGDTAIRLGGDEFVVIMPRQTGVETRAVARRLISLFSQMPWPHAELPRPTLSIGFASAACADPAAAERVLRNADVALYESKQGGRDRITAYEDRRHVA